VDTPRPYTGHRIELRLTSGVHHPQVGRILIDKGADINARDRANQLPMQVNR